MANCDKCELFRQEFFKILEESLKSAEANVGKLQNRAYWNGRIRALYVVATELEIVLPEETVNRIKQADRYERSDK